MAATNLIDLKRAASYPIPIIQLTVLGALLAFRNVADPLELEMVQRFVFLVSGGAIIAYAHGLSHSTYTRWTKAPNLPWWAQVIFIALHVGWFIYWMWYAALPTWLLTPELVAPQ